MPNKIKIKSNQIHKTMKMLIFWSQTTIQYQLNLNCLNCKNKDNQERGGTKVKGTYKSRFDLISQLSIS